MLQDIIKNGQGENLYPVVSKGNYSRFELVSYTREYALESASNSLREGISWLGLDDCVETLKKTYKINPNKPILIKKTDFTSEFTQKQQYLPSDAKLSFGVIITI